MNIKYLLILTGCLTLACFASLADTTTIGFDDLPAGTTVQGQYSGQGIVFTNGNLSWDAVIADAQAPSSPNALDISQHGGEFNSSFVQGLFTNPHHQQVSMQVGAPYYGGGQVTLTAYDAGSNVISASQVTVDPTVSSEDWVPLSVTSSGPNIAFFEVNGNHNEYIRIDNLTFDTVTSAPMPDFTLANLTGNVLLVPAGDSAPNVSSNAFLIIQMNRLNGSDGNISYSLTGLPSNVVQNIFPGVSTGTGDQLIFVELSAEYGAIPAANVPVTFTATPDANAGDYGAHSLNFNLTVGANYDAGIVDMELTQGVQSDSLPLRTINPGTGGLEASVPYAGVDLIAGKKTKVRVFASMYTPPPDNTQMPQIGCLLYGYAFDPATLQYDLPLPGSPLQTLSTSSTYPQAWYWELFVPATQRVSSDDYRFTLPSSWTTTGPIALQATLQANSPVLAPTLPPCFDCCPGNDSFTLTNIAFLQMPNIYFESTSLTVNNYDTAIKPASYVLAKTVQMLPLGDGQVATPPFGNTIDITDIWNDQNGSESVTAQTKRASEVASRLHDRLDDWGYKHSSDLLVGIYPTDPPGTVRGVYSSSCSGSFYNCGLSVAIFEDNARFLTAAAHEVGHMLGRPHASLGCTASDVDHNGCAEFWPSNDTQGTLQSYAFDLNTGTSWPGTTATTSYMDFMSYCAPYYGGDNLDTTWISAKGWEEEIYSLTMGAEGNYPGPDVVCPKQWYNYISAPPSDPVQVPDGTMIAVQAVIDETNATSAEITKVGPATSVIMGYPPTSLCTLITRDTNGNTIDNVPMWLKISHVDESELSGFVYAYVPSAGVASVEIDLLGNMVAQRTRSPNAPVVQVMGVQSDMPIPGAVGKVTKISWTATDADNDPLTAKVDYSTDGGQSWLPLFFGTNANQVTMPSSYFQATSNAIARVRVSDGFNESTNISFPFAAAGAPPTVTISSPQTGTTIGNEETLTCSGMAYDDMGNVISSNNITWYDGTRLIGRGNSVSVSGLPPVTQTITMVAQDYLGRTTGASVSINVFRAQLAGSTILPNPGAIDTNLVLWLTADTGVVSDTNGLVSVWEDQSGQGNDAIQTNSAAEPVLLPNGFQGSLPAVQFGAGNGQFLSIANQVITSQQFTIVAVVADQGNNSDSREIFSSYVDTFVGSPVSFGDTGGSPLYPVFENEFGPGDSVLHLSPGIFSVLSAVVSNIPNGPVMTTLYQNQQVIGTAGTLASQPSSLIGPYAIGALSGSSGDTFWRGDMAEVLVYNTALPINELHQVYGYLQSKYTSLPVPPQIDSIQVSGINIILTFKAQANRAYVVQTTASLNNNPVVWTTLTNLVATNSTVEVTVNDVLSSMQRFYRLEIPAVDLTSNTIPSLVTQAASSISPSSATLNGTVLPNGSDATTWFEYGTDTNYGQITALTVTPEGNTNPVPVENSIGGLASGTLYHCQLVGFNNSGMSYGGDQIFTTGIAQAPPTVSTLPATSITTNFAILNATANPNGSDTHAYFEYGTTANYGNTTALEDLGGGNTVQALEYGINFAPSTTYHYRIVAYNSGGTSYGADVTLTTGTAQPPPTVATYAATSVTSNSATLNGNVNPNGDASTTAFFQYGTTTSYGSITVQTGIGASPQNFSADISGLAPSTTYHYRIGSANTGGASYGADLTFTTGTAQSPPTVTTYAATSVTSNSATLNGNVNPNGASTTAFFQYGTTTNYGTITTQTGIGTTPQNFSADISGLAPSTTYHYRIGSANTGGASYGADLTFTTGTAQSPPTVTTYAATSVTSNSATLNGNVNPNGASTTAFFQYGTTTNYGTITTQTGIGTTPQNFSAGISGLAPSTTYHYRIVANNTGGVSYGADLTFTTGTAQLPPTVTTYAATSVTSNSATLNGNVNPNGASTTAFFQYGTTTNYGTITTQTGVGTTPQNFSAGVSGLASSTTYHYRIAANNSSSTSYGADFSFTTTAPQSPPAVTTLSPTTSQSGTSATLNASVNPEGASTTVYFQYGSTTSYGNTTSSVGVGAGTTAQSVGINVTNLAELTVYHYRAVASNSGGTTYGADVSFNSGGIQ